MVLSSGFGDVDKVRTFVVLEKALSARLFDSLGIGFGGNYCATADIVLCTGSSDIKDWFIWIMSECRKDLNRAEKTIERENMSVAKCGRKFIYNKRVERVL